MIKKAYFALGCFWRPENEFSKLNGVIKTQVGYMGGNEEKYPNPDYKTVCSKKTGYAETVKIEFDDEKISYEKLLEKFWNNHDPTQLNRQGPDIGSQYRSIIFYITKEQKEKAQNSKEELQKNTQNKIVTEIIPMKKFFSAEEYHQNYIKKGGVCFS
jgi:peptide-methionine (S)-S-oxide reductase